MLISTLDPYLAGFQSGIALERELTVAEWADAHMMLSGQASAEPGHYRTSRTPYAREPMECLSKHSTIRRTVLVFATQMAKTTLGLNWIGYVMDHAPGPMLMVQPTVTMAKRVSKQRLNPMIEATPRLRGKVREARSRDSGNTMFEKEFDGGILILTGANSAASLSSMPMRYLFLDEVDRYPSDVDDEGDPISLSVERLSNFSGAKILMTSTPTIKGVSLIERAFLESDQRRFFVPCPHCGRFDFIRWENLRWDEGRPETVALLCVECGSLIEERHKTQMLAGGEWRPTAEGDGETAGFHLPAMYSPLGWKSWRSLVARFLAVKGDPVRFKAFVNTAWAETWEERGESADPASILARREQYPAEVPNGVGVLVASVDVQGDRLECLVMGYGAAEESWVIARHIEPGDPARDDVWFAIDAVLTAGYTHESGQTMRIECVCVDSGGHHTDQVYKFCRARQARRVFAVRGGAEKGKPLVARPTRTNRYKAALFTLCTDTAKERIMARLKIGVPKNPDDKPVRGGPGYMHFPDTDWLDQEYVDQLTAEKLLPQRVAVKGSSFQRTKWVWTKTRERNEVLDLTVYCMAALDILGAAFVKSLPERAAAWAKVVDRGASEAPEPQSAAPAPLAQRPAQPFIPRRGGSWLTGWR